MSYADFLSTKRRRADETGPGIEPGDLHPALFGWQAEVVSWALRKGRAALFEDCGLGKTVQQLEWARHVADYSLLLAPLSVARQTVREAARIDLDVRYVRDGAAVTEPGVWVTNYEMADRFDPARFGAVVLDESSILKNVDGATRRRLTAQLAKVRYRLACTATPAPNDVTELCNHAEFLGRMSRAEMLAFYFVNDEFHGRTRWRLKGHAQERFYEWLASWAVGIRRPSDLGWPDDGYDLPPLRVHGEVVEVDLPPADGQLFAALGGVSGRARVRRGTLNARIERALELVNGSARVQPSMERREPGLGAGVPPPHSGPTQRTSAAEIRRLDRGASEGSDPGGCLSSSESTSSTGFDIRADGGATGDDAGRGMRSVRRASPQAPYRPLPHNESNQGRALPAVQSGARAPGGQPGTDTPPSRLRGETAWIIWCGLNEEQDALAQALGDRCFSIHGALSPDEKEARLLAWLDGERPILLSKPSICGFGLNLQRAHKMIFVGLSDSYESYYQAIRRCWRFGQRHPVDAYLIVSELEQEIVQNVRAKEAESSTINDALIRHSEVRRMAFA